MLKKIFGTFGTRLLNALCGFVTLWFGTHYLGTEAWGIGGTVVVDVSLLLIAVELLAGSGLIYYTPRKPFLTLFTISYVWTFIVVLFFAFLFYIFSFFPDFYHNIVPEGYGHIVLVLVFIYSLHNFNLNTLLGKERVGTQNILFIIQFLTQCFTMIIFIFLFDICNADAFVYSLLSGYLVAFLCGFITITPYLKDNKRVPIRESVKEMLNFGVMIQLSTLVTMINRRLSYFIIKKCTGMGDVGIYNSGTQISEATKLIGHSIALVQFSSISNMNDNDLAAKITVRFLKIAVILTTACMLVISLIPTSVFSWIFTEEFAGIKKVFVSLAPGMVFMSANMIFSHYFSGVNMPKHNLYASLVGFAVTIPAVYILIPLYGIVGGGLSASLTYLASIIYQWIVFKRTTKVKTRELIPTKEDYEVLKAEINEILTSMKHKDY